MEIQREKLPGISLNSATVFNSQVWFNCSNSLKVTQNVTFMLPFFIGIAVNFDF